MKLRLTLLLLLWGTLSITLSAQPSLVKEIYAGITSTNPVNLTVVNGKVWFQVQNLTNDTLFLYESDGTAAGTIMLLPFPQNATGAIKAFNNKIIFPSSIFGTNGEPWISDGTSAGTFMLKDIYPGSGSSGGSMIGSLGNTAFIFGLNSNITNDLGIYKTDGTTAGTTLLFNISSFSKAISFNGKMYFWGTYNAIVGLWQFDAASSQPVLMAAHTNSTYSFTYATGATEFYYVANDPLYGYEPWVCNGTAAGTFMIKDMNPGTGNGCDDGSSGSYTSMVVMNNLLYFNPFDPSVGRELWVSNGTNAGTTLLVDLSAGTGSTSIRSLVATSNKFYFNVTNSGTTYLYVSDGTAPGTIIRTDLNNTQVQVTGSKYVLDNKVVFSGTTNEFAIGLEPYVSDGTGPGTDIVADINPNQLDESMSTNVQHVPAVVGNTLFMVVDDGTNGLELWKYTAMGTAGSPIAPSNLNITPLRTSMAVTTSLYLSWSDNSSNETGFNLERSLNGTTGWVSAGAIGANSASFTDTGLTPLTMYYYRINAFNAVGGSVYSTIAFGSTLTFISDINERLQYSIFPNPVSTSATIILPGEVSAGNAVQFSVYSVSGKCFHQSELIKKETMVPLEDLSAGIYFYRLQQASGEFATGKIVVE